MKTVWIVVGLGDTIVKVFDSEEKAKAYVGKKSDIYMIEDHEVE